MLAAKNGNKVDNYAQRYCNSLNCTETLLPSIALTSDNIIRPFEEIEKEAILKTIEYCDGNVVKAAKLLKISKSYIYKLKKQWQSGK
jgi:two-component system repressor protein LuxO